ncbi:MAG: hypothetical protein KDA24_24990 [Deltaproteobacteria bacterium]|nr:hypothetical protein [Deltaproteobacteria bacterium]
MSPPSVVPPRVVLVRPKYAGNIGASARAMGNMGLSDLRLVRPSADEEWVGSESLDAWSMAASGRAILERAQIHDSLAEAVEGCTTVIACTARPRRWKAWTVLGPSESADLLAERSAEGDAVAYLFGQEDHGLSTEDLALATHLCNIPTGGEVSSLNLAQAVLLLGWEWGRAASALKRRPTKRAGRRGRAKAEQITGLAEQTGDLMARIAFFKRRPRDQTMVMLRQALTRGDLTDVEVHFLRGVVRKVRWHLENPGHLADLGEAWVDEGE